MILFWDLDYSISDLRSNLIVPPLPHPPLSCLSYFPPWNSFLEPALCGRAYYARVYVWVRLFCVFVCNANPVNCVSPGWMHLVAYLIIYTKYQGEYIPPLFGDIHILKRRGEQRRSRDMKMDTIRQNPAILTHSVCIDGWWAILWATVPSKALATHIQLEV